MYIGLKCQIYCKETHLSLPYGAGCDTGKLTSMALVDAFIVLRRSDAFFSRTWIGKETSTVGVFFLRYRRKRYLGFVEGIVAPYKGELAFKRSSRRVARGETPPRERVFSTTSPPQNSTDSTIAAFSICYHPSPHHNHFDSALLRTYVTVIQCAVSLSRIITP